MIYFVSIIIASLFFVPTTHAQTATNCVNIDNSRICLDMGRQGTRYDIYASINGESLPLSCQIRTPGGNTIIDFLRACNDSFVHEGGINGVFTIYVTANNQIVTFTYDMINNIWLYMGRNTSGGLPQATQRTINTSFGGWTNNTTTTSGPSTTLASKFGMTVSPFRPRINERMTMTITAQNSNGTTRTNYTNRVAFAVSYRTSTNGNRILDRTQSTYTRHGIDNVFRIERSDMGSVRFVNALSFQRRYDYKITISDGRTTNEYLIRVQ